MQSQNSTVHQARDYPWGAVVAVVFQAGQFLAIKRSQLVKAPGAVCFAGGGVEAGESQADAIVREMQEELALAVEPLDRVWECRTPRGVQLHFWHVRPLADTEPSPNPAEVESWGWFTPQALRQQPQLLSSASEFLDDWDLGRIKLAIEPC